jgi:hypothetical protein
VIEFEVEQTRNGLTALSRAVAAESDGKALKRDLGKRLRAVMEPVRQQVIRRLQSTGGSAHEGPRLRDAVARQTRAGVRFSGRNTGVNLVQRTRGMPRGFNMAGRAMNRAEGWQAHATARQHARPAEWFDEPAKASVDEARRAALAAMEDMARRLAERAKRG